tara:strand:+ start:6837 stop:7700 length:864 start_codon:yes stop_codon:yes gene_type:complete
MKNISIVQAKKNHQNIIIEFLIKNHVWKAPKSKWLNIFNNNWSNVNNYGYILFDDEEIVGYFGLIFSHNQHLKFNYTANIHSWVVLPKYRAYSLWLLRKVVTLENTFFISHSTINKILKIYYKFNWKILDESHYYLFGSFSFGSKAMTELIDHNNYQLLPGDIKNIYNDHKEYNSIFMKLTIEKKSIYMIGKIKKFKKIFNFFEIIYISDVVLFNIYIDRLIRKIKKATNCSFLRIDSRFIKSPKKLISKKMKIKNFKKIYFCKNNINCSEYINIHNLYSEIFLLDT